MIQQISLFAEQEREIQWKFADKVCEEFNKLDTVFQFFVSSCILEQWTHVPMKNKTLNISISAFGVSSDNSFMQFKGDRKSQYNICNILNLSEWMGKVSEDKDFNLTVTPWNIYIYYHNFEKKKFDL